jgi:hypothetical protein
VLHWCGGCWFSAGADDDGGVAAAVAYDYFGVGLANSKNDNTQCRWDKNNFDGNDDLGWLQAAAVVLEDMRTDLLAFGIQVRCYCVFISGFSVLSLFQGSKNPPSSVRRLGLLLSPTNLPLPLAGGGPALKISRSADESQNIHAMLGEQRLNPKTNKRAFVTKNTPYPFL